MGALANLYLLLYLLAVVQVTGSAVFLYQRCFKPQILQITVKQLIKFHTLMIKHFI